MPLELYVSGHSRILHPSEPGGLQALQVHRHAGLRHAQRGSNSHSAKNIGDHVGRHSASPAHHPRLLQGDSM